MCTVCVIYCIALSLLCCGYEVCSIFRMLHLWGQLFWQASYGFIYSLFAWARIVAQNRPQLFPSVSLISRHSHSFSISCRKTHALNILTSRELLFLIFISKKVLILPYPPPPEMYFPWEGRMCIYNIISCFSGPLFVVLYVSMPLVLIQHVFLNSVSLW